MKKMSNSFRNNALLISLALLVPGCGGPGKDSGQQNPSAPVSSQTDAQTTGVVLLSITDEQGNQRPLITEGALNDYINVAVEANPQLRMVLEMMPDAEHLIYTGQKRSKILREWAQKNKVDQQEGYKRDLDMIIDMARSNLDAQYFQKQLKIDVSDSEVRSYYDKHKDEMPGLLVSPEGVKAQGVVFDSEDKAKSFLAKVKAPGADFKKVAQADKLEVDDFGGTLSSRSFVDKKVKDKILALKKLPAFELISVDKKFWVINAISKEKAQYAPFDQVKENLRSMLKEQEIAKAFEKEFEKLEKEYGITENKTYFEEKKKKKEDDRKKAEEAQKDDKTSQAAPRAESDTKELA